MVRFLVGLLVGAGLLAAIAFVWMRGTDACLGRCGDGTKCDNHRCVVATAAPPVVTKETKRRRKHGNGLGGAAPEIQLQPGDEIPTAQGDALGRPEHLDLSKPDEHELSDQEIDEVMRGANASIVKCISDAVGDAPLESGKIELGIRIEKTGKVSRTRVTAPRLLQRNGLTQCLRGVAGSLHFPASGGSSVYTGSFNLQ
jgi:hypothetical protein